ncbi:MAG: translocation/assembly module TamB domain-containing protein, partial [Planctomycetota bacterium]
REENLLLFLSASGRTDLGGDTRLHTASLEVKTPADRFQAKLTQPVLDFRSGGTWPVDLQAQGQLENWPARIRTWISLDDWDPAGAYELDAQATASTDRITVSRARLAVGQLRLRTPALDIDEPAVELVLAGYWDRQQGRLQMEPVTLTSNSLAIQAEQLVVEMPEEDSPKIAGSLQYRGNLERLHRWIADPKAERKWHIAGQLSGTAELSQSQGLADAQLDADVGDLVVTFSSGNRFQEPRIHLAARGSYEHQARMLELKRLDLSSSTLAARTAGRIVRTGDQGDKTDVQLAGQVDYDLEKLGELLRPYVGSGVQIVGRGTGPASYRGPLELAKAQANAGVRWERAEAYGFQVGPGELNAALADGILQAEPLGVAVNGGRLLLAPRLRLAPEPTELTLPPGPLVQQVQITPAMCASGLKYIAPVLADVSTAQGNFSIALDGCRIPLDDPAKGELAGRLTIHSVQVGHGPLVRELAVLLGRAAPATLRRESVVPFRMVGGRVYHQGLELIFPDLTIRTYGSVGLDQTLALMAEMPVPPKWLGNNVLGSALRNQTIRLPIGGTLSKPKLNEDELRRISRQFLENAARNVIEDELNRRLERLLGPPR